MLTEEDTLADIPAGLRVLIAEALASLWKDEHGGFLPRHRQGIYRFLGSLDTPAGRHRRAELAVQCVKLLYPRWKRAFPEDPLVDQLLERTKQVLAGSADMERTDDDMCKLWEQFFDPRESTYTRSPAWTVALCAIQAVWVAVGNDCWRGWMLSKETANEDLDPERWDAAHCAELALRPSIDGGIGLMQRLRFWTWWLTRAVPQAATALQAEPVG